MIFKGSWPALKFQDCIWRYLGSRTRLRIQNSSVGVIFEALQDDHKNFPFFEIFQ